MSVGRANSMLSIKTARTEAVKAGLRLALAEPTRLYETCGPPLGGANVGDPRLLGERHRRPGRDQVLLHRPGAVPRHPTEVRHGLAAVQNGQTVPARNDQLRIRVAEPDVDERVDRRYVVDVRDRQDLVARPADARAVAQAPGRMADARPSSCRRSDRVHGVLPRYVSEPRHASTARPTSRRASTTSRTRSLITDGADVVVGRRR